MDELDRLLCRRRHVDSHVVEKYNIEELIIRFLQQDINEEELRYLESWLEEDAEHKSYFFGLKGISDSSRRSFFLEGRGE